MVNFWLEKTDVNGKKDRETGEYSLGNAMWSPQRDIGGADIYKFMRDVKSGDVILHLIDREDICGISKAASSVDTNFKGLEHTEWSGRGGYLIKLKDFIKFKSPINRNDLLNETYKSKLLEIQSKFNIFYTSKLTLRQGAYITEIPNDLLEIINKIYYDKTGQDLPYIYDSIRKTDETKKIIHISRDLIVKALDELGKTKASKSELIPKIKEMVERDGQIFVDDKTAWTEILNLSKE